MNRIKFRITSWAILTFLSIAAFGQGGRVEGLVVDSSGAVIEGVRITLTGVGFSFEKTTKTSKKGKFQFALTNAAQDYLVRLEKEGFETAEWPLHPRSGQTIEGTYPMVSIEEAAQQGVELAELEVRDKATKAYNVGASAYKTGDLELAIEGFRESVSINPNLAEGWAALARVLLEQEQWNEAQVAAEKLLEVSPGEALGLQMLYDAYDGAGNQEKAQEVMQQMIAGGGGRGAAARVFNEGVAAVKDNDIPRARANFEKALELDASLYQALLPLAQIYYATGELDAAIAKAEEFLAHEPAHGRANVVRYSAYKDLGRTEEAEAAFAEIKQNSPVDAADMFYRTGLDQFNSGETENARKSFETVLQLDPSFAKANYHVALCYASSGDNAQAKAALEKFLEQAPDDPDVASAREMLTYLN